MDQRLLIIAKIEESHIKLMNSYHSQVLDNSLLLEFCNLFIELVQAIKPNKSPKLFDYIFKAKPNLEDKKVLNAHLFTASQYSQILVKRIKENPFLNLSNELIGVLFDYPQLLYAIQKVYNIPFRSIAGSRNMKVDSYASYKIAVQIFWAPRDIQRSNTLNGYVIFALRQAIELAGKEIIGLENILDKKGAVYHYGTQIP